MRTVWGWMTLMWLQRGNWWELFEGGWLQCDCKGVIDENCLRVDDFSVTAKGIIDENCLTLWGWMTLMWLQRGNWWELFEGGWLQFDYKGVTDENCLRVDDWYDYKGDNWWELFQGGWHSVLNGSLAARRWGQTTPSTCGSTWSSSTCCGWSSPWPSCTTPGWTSAAMASLLTMTAGLCVSPGSWRASLTVVVAKDWALTPSAPPVATIYDLARINKSGGM